MDTKYIFFYGAGTEVELKQPSGFEYKKKTLFEKNDEMLSALSNKFNTEKYRDEENLNYISDHRHDVIAVNFYNMFMKSFFITLRSTNEDMYKEIVNEYKSGSDEHKRVFEKYTKKVEEEIEGKFYENIDHNGEQDKDLYIGILDKLLECSEYINNKNNNSFEYIEKIFNDSDQLKRTFKKIIENINGFGDIERYFHTLIHPNKYGKNNVWKLINFYWQSWFIIIEVLIKCIYEQEDDKSKEEIAEKYYIEDNKTIDYKKVLLNIEDLVKNIDMSIRKMNFQDTTYYNFKEFGEDRLKNISFVTTNYTPFLKNAIRSIDSECSLEVYDSLVYLHGEIDMFENPYRRTVASIKDINSDNEIYFPYMLCQSSLKPVIANYQIKQFNKFVEILMPEDDTNKIMIFVGYSLNEDDSHIISMVNEFLSNKNHYLVYFKYEKDTPRTNEIIPEDSRLGDIKESIIKILRAESEAEDRIIVEYIGDPEAREKPVYLYNKIKDVISKINIHANNS